MTSARDSNLSTHHTHPHSARVVWEWFEALVGLLAAFALTFAVPTISGLALLLCVFMGAWDEASIAFPLFIVSAPMAVWLASMCEKAITDFRMEQLGAGSSDFPTPFGICLARQLPPIPFLLRLPLTAWWLCHFLAGVAVVEIRNVIAQALGLPIINGVVAYLFCFAFQFAATVFLTLAIGSAQTSSELTESAWRYRFWINGTIILALALRLFF